MSRRKKYQSKKLSKLPKVNAELSGFDIMINSFGEIESTLSIDKINDFLGKNLPDKKLKEQEDKPDMKK